jgi:hypothetical protein
MGKRGESKGVNVKLEQEKRENGGRGEDGEANLGERGGEGDRGGEGEETGGGGGAGR